MKLSDDKYYNYFRFLYWWYIDPDRLGKIKQICCKNSWKRVAIYGMGAIGELLLSDFCKIGADAVYAIDRNPDSIFWDYPVYSLDDELPLMDIIIVTPFMQYDSIVKELETRTTTKTLNALDLIMKDF